MLRIIEIFGNTIQGEGERIFVPSVFIRLAGCNLKREGCDTSYSFGEGTEMSIDKIIKQVKKYKCREIVISGGEPLVQEEELVELVEELIHSYEITIETNCTIVPNRFGKRPVVGPIIGDALYEKVLWSVSPKLKGMGGKVWYNEEAVIFFRLVKLGSRYFKFVITGEDDIVGLKRFLEDYDMPNETIYVQPDGRGTLEEYAKRYRWLVETLAKDKEIGLHRIKIGLQAHRIAFGSEKGK